MFRCNTCQFQEGRCVAVNSAGFTLKDCTEKSAFLCQTESTNPVFHIAPPRGRGVLSSNRAKTYAHGLRSQENQRSYQGTGQLQNKVRDLIDIDLQSVGMGWVEISENSSFR